MLFRKLKLIYFGQFHNREIELKPGINLIYGENEAGKSTVHTFIKGMLFGIERMRGRGSASKEDLYTRYLPWEYPGAFRGQMDITVDAKEYRLQRSFHANDKSFTVTDLDTGREVSLKEGLISELIPGLTQSAYKNTVSVEQLKAQTDMELANQVRNYIANLSIAKSKEVNVAKAVNLLTNKKKIMEADQNASAAYLKELQNGIQECLAREGKSDSLCVKLKALNLQEQKLKKEKEALTAVFDNETGKRMEELPAILEKYNSLKELLAQIQSIEKQAEDHKNKISLLEKECGCLASLKEDMKEAGRLNGELEQLTGKRIGLEKEYETSSGKRKSKNYLLAMIPALIASVICILAIKPVTAGISLAAAVFILCEIFCFILNHSSNHKKKEYEVQTNGLEAKITDVNNRLKSIFQRNRAASLEELNSKQEEFMKNSFDLGNNKAQLAQLINRQAELEDKCDLLHDTIMKYMQYFISQEELTQSSIERLKEAVGEKKQEAAAKQAEINLRYNDGRLQMEKIRWELSTLEGNEEQLLKLNNLYELEEQKQEKEEQELEAVKLALSTIQSLSADIHDSFGKQLNRAVSDIIGKVTGNKYNDLSIDEKLEIKAEWNGEYVPLDRLSAGTMDQIYFALRLAVADLLLGKDEMPLILDDSFALYDDYRVKAALQLIAERRQILLFSCHTREKRLLEEMKLPFHYVNLSC